MRNTTVTAEQLRLAVPGPPEPAARTDGSPAVSGSARTGAQARPSTPSGRRYLGRVRAIPLASIALAAKQLRDAIDPAALGRLAADLDTHGLLHLPGVRALGPERYEAVWGNRRILAAREAGWREIHAVLVNVGDLDALLLGARLCGALLAIGLSPVEIHRRLGIDPADVSRLTRAVAHPELGPALARGDITWGEARELVGVPVVALPALIEVVARRRRAGSPMSLTGELRPLVRAARPSRFPRRAVVRGDEPGDCDREPPAPGQFVDPTAAPGGVEPLVAIRSARVCLEVALNEPTTPPWAAGAVSELEALASAIAAMLLRRQA